MEETMQVVTDFFTTIYHELPPNSNDTVLDTQVLDSLPIELTSILLCVNANNLEIYTKSNIFTMLLQQILHSSSQHTIENIKSIQQYLLYHTESTSLKLLKPYILRLNAAELLSNSDARNLIHFFTQASFNKDKNTQNNEKQIDIKALCNELETIYKKLHELQLGNHIDTTLQTIYNNAKNHKFSIGITGVLSAGKSTFLNALLGKEILGSSTVPETANLTILKYGEKEYAKVYFWNKQEWLELEKTAQYDKGLQNFVQESKEIFGEKIHDFITQDTKSTEIPLNELSIYTSANHASKLCNLVKKVELFTHLKFLQNGVEIVDTPGLDDPITKREEITKDYIAHCDLLIHVMNASCVATQIDIDFILESLLHQNISRLLVVLTRIDLISEKDLEQSLEYTKSTLAMQLRKSEYKGDIENLIERIDFIPLASFFALLHKIGQPQKAIDKGFNLEKTGIVAVEQYLDKMLLGEDSLKQKDIMYLAYRGFLKTTRNAQDEIALELKIFNASKEDLESMIENLKQENANLLERLHKKQNENKVKQQELEGFLDSLQNFVNKSLKSEQDKLRSRIYDEAIYEYGRNNTVSKERVLEILELGFSDCFSDLSREYKYKLAKKITQMFEEYTDKTQPQIIFHAPKTQIAQSLAILQDSVPRLIASHSKSNQEELVSKLDSKFQESFHLFGNTIAEKNKEIREKFLDYFKQIAQLQHDEIQEQIAKKENILHNTLAQREKSNAKDIRNSILHKQKELEGIVKELDYITNALQ